MAKYTISIKPDTDHKNLSFSKNYRIYTTVQPVKYAKNFTEIVEDIDMGSGVIANLKRYFRYSLDNASWSMWYPFIPTSVPDMNMITSIPLNQEDDLYVSLKYEYDDGSYNGLITPITINELKVRGEHYDIKVQLDLAGFNPQSNCTEEYCPAITFNRNPTFNPYDMGGFINIYKEMSRSINTMFGHQVLYFQTQPASGGGDYIFREWNLYDVTNRKCVKVLIDNNEFPDNKATFNDFGVDFEMPFEVQIDNVYFKSIFGKGSDPRKKDFLYFPLVNRMYEIQGCYLYRGFMMEPLYWKVQLVKFTPNINYLKSAETTQFLDNLLLDSEETLSEIANKDVEDALLPKQYKTISTQFDETRSGLNDLLSVPQTNLYMNYAVLVDNYYDFTKIVDNNVAVQYKYPAKLDENMSNITFMALFQIKNGTTNVRFIKAFDSESPFNGISFDGIYNHGLEKLTVGVHLGSQTRTSIVNHVLVDKWYGIIVQVSKQYKQIGMFVYDLITDLSDTNNNTDFNLKHSQIIPIDDVTISTINNYYLPASGIYIANIRLFKESIQQEEHMFVLSQLFVKTESLLYLIDNCRPKLNIPFIMKKK